MKKIIPHLFGGIGNQLFIYVAARRLSLVNNAELVLDDVSGFVRDYVYQRHYQLDHFNIPCRKATMAERMEPFSRVRRYLKRRRNARLPFDQRGYIQQEGFDFDPRLLQLKPRGDLYLEGYWQSEDYFKDVETTIRQDLQIQPPIDAVNQAMANRIRCQTAVAVHVRFFIGEPHKNAPGDYYHSAIAEMERRVDNAHYYLFSDCSEAARSSIPLPDERITLVSHNQGDENAYADLWLMTQCRHFIIANSTFSWWGAWLAAHAETHVIALGIKWEMDRSWGFKGLLPERWIKL
jgi:hypothetical protein